MPRRPATRSEPLRVDDIVDAAIALIARSGLAGLSMRKLGAELGVDPMAVYHHVTDKRALLALVTGRVVGAMPLPDAGGAWDARVRAWARAYWDVVVANRDLTAAGLADPVIAEGGIPLLAPLSDAIADSGLPPHLIEPNAFLVVDFVHGAALGAAAPLRHDGEDLTPLVRAFDAGLDTIVAGIRHLAAGSA